MKEAFYFLLFWLLIIASVLGLVYLWLEADSNKAESQCELDCLIQGHPQYRSVLDRCFCVNWDDDQEVVVGEVK